jgi:hypothetical protein
VKSLANDAEEVVEIEKVTVAESGGHQRSVSIHEESVLSLEVVDGIFSRECYVVNKHLRCLCVYMLNSGGGFNCDCLCFLSSVTVHMWTISFGLYIAMEPTEDATYFPPVKLF